MKEKRIGVEYSDEFMRLSKTYKKVLQHRKKCKKWGKGFCLECFGGGLTQFAKNLLKEMPIYILLELLNNDWLNDLGKENLIRKMPKENKVSFIDEGSFKKITKGKITYGINDKEDKKCHKEEIDVR